VQHLKDIVNQMFPHRHKMGVTRRRTIAQVGSIKKEPAGRKICGTGGSLHFRAFH
jgi:hypothetical protein